METLIQLYQTVIPAALVLGAAGFAATFALNNAITHFRANLYETDAYADVAKRLQSIDPAIDAARPLRILMGLTTGIRFGSPALVVYAAAMPKSYAWVAIIGLVLFLAWLVVLVLWLASIWHHQRHEVELTSRKLNEKRDATKIDSGLGVS